MAVSTAISSMCLLPVTGETLAKLATDAPGRIRTDDSRIGKRD